MILAGVALLAASRIVGGAPRPDEAVAASGGASSSSPSQLQAPDSPIVLAPFDPNAVQDGAVIRRDFVMNGDANAAPVAPPISARADILTYTVQAGDTVFGIANLFGLAPETVLWANYTSLKDDPDLLSVDQQLLIPPVDGVIVEVEMGDTVDGLARLFKVTPDVIVTQPINGLRSVNDLLPVGRLLFVPGGERELVVWQLPKPIEVGTTQVRTQRGVVKAKVYNVGSCGNVAIPALGSGSLLYPTGSSYVSGYNFRGSHGGIDFGGKMNIPIFAADSGTVVYAGDALNASGRFVGYGRYVVLDHGNGYRTLYAHNSSLTVSCGQQVSKGEVIALMGSTGNSTGPHSHFEVRASGSYVNPWTLLPPR